MLYNRDEYVYYYNLPVSELEGDDEKYREDILRFIKKDLGKKTVESTDYFTSFETGKTSFVICSDKQENPFFVPLFYEIYAYTKLEDLSKFSYKFETLIFKETTLLKFKVKCYGKK